MPNKNVQVGRLIGTIEYLHENTETTLKYLINEHVRLSSLDFDSTMFVYFPVCSFILLIFFPLCSFITSCSFMIMVNNVPNTLRYLLNQQCLSSAGALLAVALLAVALLAGALLTAQFKLDMEQDFYIIDIIKFPFCLQSN